MKHYKTIQVNGIQVRLHRHLIESKLNRKLGFNEVVHHINGNKHDNRIENLELVSRSEHMKLHPEILEKWIEKNSYNFDIETIKEMYKTMSIKKIADHFGVAAMTIWYRLKKENITTNKRGHKF
jgi:hypothetical protein